MLQLPEDSARPPAVGSAVQVRWVDGDLYGAVFKGVRDTTTVEVLQSGFVKFLLLGRFTGFELSYGTMLTLKVESKKMTKDLAEP